jgi:hypothetical protein
MLIRQLSVFLENRQGKFAEIARLLGNNNINMKAFTVSESDDFGIARIIVEREKIDTAYNLLKSHSYAVGIHQVNYLNSPNKPGAMAIAMEELSKAGVSIEYMYAFADDQSHNSHLVIRTNNDELANRILSEL